MTGPATLVELHLGDESSSWAAAGFTAVDDRVQLGPLTLVCTGDGSGPLLGFDRDLELDGADVVTVPLSEHSAPDHPNGIDGFDHIVIMAPHLGRIRDAVLAAGFEIRREREASLGGSGITQLFVWAGAVLMEIVAPTAADDPGGPSQVWGLAVTATDLDATAGWFGERISAPKPAVQPGRRIATIRHRDLGIGVPLAVMTTR